MRNDKYEDILYFVEMMCDNDILDFDEDISEMITILNKNDTTKFMTPKFWDNLLDICEKSKSVPLMLAILKCKDAPTDCIDKIAKIDNGEYIQYTVVSEHMNTKTMLKILDKIGTEGIREMLEMDGEYFSNKTIDCLCAMPESVLKELIYFPFVLVNKDCVAYHMIPEMLTNEENKYFKDEIPIDFLTHIENNENLPDEIRNEAFNKGYVAEDLHHMTDYMAKEIYVSCAETLFEFNPETKEERDAQERADCMLAYMASRKLPISCRLDFINRISPTKGITLYSTEKLLASNENNSSVMVSALQINSYEILDMVKKNRKFLTEKVVNEMLNKSTANELRDVFVSAVLRNTMSNSLINKFIDKDSLAIEMALMASYHTLPKQCEKLVKENAKRKIPFCEIDYLYKVRNYIFENFNMPFSQRIMNSIVYTMITHTDVYRYSNTFQRPHTSQERLFSEVKENKDWCRIPDDKIKDLRNLFTELKEDFLKYKDATETIISDIETAYHKSKLPNKYPQLFSKFEHENPVHINWWEEYCQYQTVISKVNFKAIKLLNKEQLQELIEDIKTCDDEPTIKAILSAVKIGIDIRDLLDMNEVYQYIYEFADLYNTLNEKMEELEFENAKESKDEEEPIL